MTTSFSAKQNILQTEQNLFARIQASAAQQRANPNEDNFHNDVLTVERLIHYLLGTKETPIIQAPKLSKILGKNVSLELESNLQPGGSIKGRAVFGILFQNLRDYLIENPQRIEKLSEKPAPLQELIKEVFDNAVVVSNSSGNHASAVAAVFGKLAEEYNIKIDTVGFLPKGAPAYKQNIILDKAPDSDEISPLQFYDPKTEDRDVKIAQYGAHEEDRGRKVFLYPTEPNKKVNGGFIGLATLPSRNLGNVDVWFPSSSGPTAGAAIKYNRDAGAITLVQHSHNGGFIKQLLEAANKGEIKVTPAQYAKLLEKKQYIDQVREEVEAAGGALKAPNGLSTPHISTETFEQIVDKQGNLTLSPDNVKLVSDAGIKLAAAIVYYETGAIGEATLPEQAGAAAVAALLEEKIAQKDPGFAKSIAAVVAEEGYDKFISLTGLTKPELKQLGLENLDKEVKLAETIPAAVKGWAERFSAKKSGHELVAIVSGANREQPLELAVRDFIRAGQLVDPTDLVEEFEKANSAIVYQLLNRKETRVIDGATFHSGVEFAEAIHNALELKQKREITYGLEGGYRYHTALGKRATIAQDVGEELVAYANTSREQRPGIAESIELIARLQSQAGNFIDDYRFEKKEAFALAA